MVVFVWISPWIEIVVCCGSICMDQFMEWKLLFAVVIFVWISSWIGNCCLVIMFIFNLVEMCWKSLTFISDDVR